MRGVAGAIYSHAFVLLVESLLILYMQSLPFTVHLQNVGLTRNKMPI